MSSNCCFKGKFKIISPYHIQNARKVRYMGMELVGISNIRVYATCDGEIEKTGYDNDKYGKYVIIKGKQGLRHLFAHFSSISVREGERVYKQKTSLGIQGSSGKVTTKCIYYEIKNGPEEDAEYVDVAAFMEVPNEMGIFDSETCGRNDLILPPSPEVVQKRTGKYYPKCDESFDVLENALYSIGVDNTTAHIKEIAYKNGIENYRGQYKNKTLLLEKLKEGKLIKA